jgi:hypothetical protein
MAEKKTRVRKPKAEAQPVVSVEATEQPKENKELKSGQVQVNVDFLRKTKVHIAMPCYGGMLTEATFMSFIKWANTAKQLGIEWTLETMVNESLISRGRNTLTAKFLGSSENTTHLMFIDADIGWEPWHLLVLLNRDVDVIGGLYPMKTMPIKWVVNGFEGAEEGADGLQEVSKAGIAFSCAFVSSEKTFIVSFGSSKLYPSLAKSPAEFAIVVILFLHYKLNHWQCW